MLNIMSICNCSLKSAVCIIFYKDTTRSLNCSLSTDMRIVSTTALYAVAYIPPLALLIRRTHVITATNDKERPSSRERYFHQYVRNDVLLRTTTEGGHS